MAGKSSSQKRHEQSETRRMRNRKTKSTVRTANKKFILAVQNKDQEGANEAFRECEKLLDTAKSKGIYHQNTVARKKSRLHKMLNKMEQAGS